MFPFSNLGENIMTPQRPDDSENLLKRLAALEVQVRFQLRLLKWGLSTLAILFIGIVYAGYLATKGKLKLDNLSAEDINVRGIRVHDRNRRFRGSIYGDSKEGLGIQTKDCLVFHGDNIAERLKITKEGISFRDKNGIERAALGLNEDKPFLLFRDPKGTPQVGLLAKSDSCFLTFFDQWKGNALFGIDIDGPGLKLFDSNSKPRAAFKYVPETGAGLVLWDANGVSLKTLP
jgi:hypothetical protein